MYALHKSSKLHLIRNALGSSLRYLHVSMPTTFSEASSAIASSTRNKPSHKPGFKDEKKFRVTKNSQKASVQVDLSHSRLTYHSAWLRDACPGPCCIDKSTTQKTFQTSDVPKDIDIRHIEYIPEGGVKITWKNDLPQYDETREHVSVYSREFFENHASSQSWPPADELDGSLPWNSETLSLLHVPYEKFMEADRDLYQALKHLVCDGIIMIKGVPSTEDSVELIAKRIGNLRDSLYGRTWNVRSVPKAKNVAYTSTFLGLHMDLLYMKDPPGIQLLHCLKNSCHGGTAIFSDSFNAAKNLSDFNRNVLEQHKTAYHYRNNNEYYYHKHTTLEFERHGSSKPVLKYVNWSPPFQANYPILQGDQQIHDVPLLFEASTSFAKLVEARENTFRYDYEEGDCVIFNNRRVLHGREAFQAEGGERWLRGAYVDTDVFQSRIRVLCEQV